MSEDRVNFELKKEVDSARYVDQVMGGIVTGEVIHVFLYRDQFKPGERFTGVRTPVDLPGVSDKAFRMNVQNSIDPEHGGTMERVVESHLILTKPGAERIVKWLTEQLEKMT